MLIRNVRTMQLPFLHPKVDIKDFANEKGHILYEEQADAIKKYLASKPAGYYSKHLLNEELKLPQKIPYGILVMRDPLSADEEDSVKAESGVTTDSGDLATSRVGKVRFFVVYRGQDRNPNIEERKNWYVAETCNANIKLVQEMDTGKWFVMKVQEFRSHLAQSVEFNAEGKATVVVNTAYINEWYKDLKREFENLNIANQHVGHILTRHSKKRHVTKGYIVMNLMPGLMLRTILEFQQMPVVERLNIGLQILYRVNELNNKGLLHCDIKPENMVYHNATQQLKLVDWFSLARMDPVTKISQQECWGTSHYMPPELLKAFEEKGRRLSLREYEFSPQTEAYSVAATLKVLFHMPIKYVTILMKGQVAVPPAKDEDNWYRKGKPNELTDNVEIKNLLDTMMNSEPSQRMLISDAILIYEKIIAKLAPQNQLKKIALLDFADFYTMFRGNDRAAKNAILDKLALFDEICFISHSDADITYRFQIDMLMLARKKKLPYYNSIIITPDPISLASVPDIMEIQNHKAARHFTFVNFKDPVKSRTISTANALGIDKPEVQLQLLLKGINVINLTFNQALAQFRDELDESLAPVAADALKKPRKVLQQKYVEYKDKILQHSLHTVISSSPDSDKRNFEKWENMRSDVENVIEDKVLISAEKLVNLLEHWNAVNQASEAHMLTIPARGDVAISPSPSPKDFPRNTSSVSGSMHSIFSSTARTNSIPRSPTSNVSTGSAGINLSDARTGMTHSK